MSATGRKGNCQTQAESMPRIHWESSAAHRVSSDGQVSNQLITTWREPLWMTWYCSSRLNEVLHATLSRRSTWTHMLATYLERTGGGRWMQSRCTCRTLCKMNMFEIFWKDSGVKQERGICRLSVVEDKHVTHWYDHAGYLESPAGSWSRKAD